MPQRIALLTAAAVLLLSLGAWAQWADPPIVLHTFPEGDELVIQGMYLSLDGSVEPTVTLGDELLTIVSFSPTEIRALLPAPPPAPGTYLLTVEKVSGVVGACDVTVSAADISCVNCVSEVELDFDPATQDELAAEEAARIADVDAEEAARIAALAAEEAARIAADAAEATARAAQDAALGTAISQHVTDTNNPHQVAFANPDPPCYSDGWDRFVDCGNGTVTDTVTGLIWLKDPGALGNISGSYAWANDFAVHDVQHGHFGLTDGSRPGDWRLPTYEEWLLILRPTCLLSGGLLIVGKSGRLSCFGDDPWAVTGSGWDYWTATKDDWVSLCFVAAGPCAWEADLSNGILYQIRTGALFKIWPVRDGK